MGHKDSSVLFTVQKIDGAILKTPVTDFSSEDMFYIFEVFPHIPV